MKVKELIEQLKKLDQEKVIKILGVQIPEYDENDYPDIEDYCIRYEEGVSIDESDDGYVIEGLDIG